MEHDAVPPITPPADPPPAGGADPTPIRVAVLVSAIFNLLSAIAWAFTCFGLVLSVPLVVLAVFEILLFSRLGGSGPYAPLRGRVRLIGVLEICTILAGNLVSLICGIIVLAFLDKLHD